MAKQRTTYMNVALDECDVRIVGDESGMNDAWPNLFRDQPDEMDVNCRDAMVSAVNMMISAEYDAYLYPSGEVVGVVENKKRFCEDFPHPHDLLRNSTVDRNLDKTLGSIMEMWDAKERILEREAGA